VHRHQEGHTSLDGTKKANHSIERGKEEKIRNRRPYSGSPCGEPAGGQKSSLWTMANRKESDTNDAGRKASKKGKGFDQGRGEHPERGRGTSENPRRRKPEFPEKKKRGPRGRTTKGGGTQSLNQKKEGKAAKGQCRSTPAGKAREKASSQLGGKAT